MITPVNLHNPVYTLLLIIVGFLASILLKFLFSSILTDTCVLPWPRWNRHIACSMPGSRSRPFGVFFWVGYERNAFKINVREKEEKSKLKSFSCVFPLTFWFPARKNVSVYIIKIISYMIISMPLLNSIYPPLKASSCWADFSLFLSSNHLFCLQSTSGWIFFPFHHNTFDEILILIIFRGPSLTVCLLL